MIYSYTKTNEMQQFLKSIFGIDIYMFRRVSLSIIRSLPAGSGWHISIPLASSQPKLCDIYNWCVYSAKFLMMDRETVRNMYSFTPKNKFQKLVHVVGFIIKNARPTSDSWSPPDSQVGFMALPNTSRCLLRASELSFRWWEALHSVCSFSLSSSCLVCGLQPR